MAGETPLFSYMNSIKLKDKPFIIIGSSGQEKTLTQELVNKYNSIAINKSPFKVDIIFRYDFPDDILTDLSKCDYFCTNIKYKDYPKYQDEKCKFFEPRFNVISDSLPVLGAYRFTTTVALNFISIVRPLSEVYLVGIDHSKDNYDDSTVRRFIEQYKTLLRLYQTDFNSVGWNLEYKEIK